MGFLTGLQVALFFKDRVERPDQIATNVNDTLGNAFDRMPTVIPVPEDAPVEIPVVMMTSSKLPYHLNFSRKRVDLILPHSGPVERGEEQRNQFVEFAKNFSDQMAKVTKINRIGVISHYYHPIDDIPKYLNSRFTNHSIDKKAEEISIHYNIKKKKNGFITNNLVTIQEQNFMNGDEMAVKGVYFMFDKNNHPSDKSLQKNFIHEMIDGIDSYLGINILDFISGGDKK